MEGAIKMMVDYFPHDNFSDNLMLLIQKSTTDLSLENDSFIEFISLFDKTNNLDNEILIFNSNYSRSLYELLRLDMDQLKILYDFLIYIQKNFPNDEVMIFEDNLFRGKNDIKWLLDLSKLQLNISENFEHIQFLKSNQIIDSDYQGTNEQLELYFIDLLKNRHWKSISNKDVLLFLQGGDFYFLTNQAYFFILPACVKLCIDLLKNGEFTNIPIEEILQFLKNANRFENIDLNAKILINNFINLLSNQSYHFFCFNNCDLKELVLIWNYKPVCKEN